MAATLLRFKNVIPRRQRDAIAALVVRCDLGDLNLPVSAPDNQRILGVG